MMNEPTILRRPRLRLLRYVWASPATLVGLALAGPAWVLGATFQVRDGVVEVAGGWLAGRIPFSLGIGAITFGHVVLGVSQRLLNVARPHEHVHVRQYERWGVLFFPLYLASSAWEFLRGRRPYLDNAFERPAFQTDCTVACTPPSSKGSG